MPNFILLMDIIEKVINVQDLENFINFDEESNPKRIFIVLKGNNNDYSELLTKMMSAVQKDIHKDVQLIHLKNNTHIALSTYLKKIDAAKVFLFGISPKYVCLNYEIKKYEIFEFYNSKILWVDDLKILSNNINLKKNLWIKMKEIFQI